MAMGTGGRPLTAGIISAALVLAGASGVAPAEAASSRHPDLVVASVTVDPQHVAAGRAVQVTDKTKNIGSTRAAASGTGYYLSKDKVRSRRDPLVGSRAVPKLSPGHRSSATAQVAIPGATRAGRYYVLACADVAKKVRESDERNNCRASGSLRVTAPPPPPPPSTDEGPSDEARDLMLDRAGPMNIFAAPPPVSTRTARSTFQDGRAITRTIGTAGGHITVTDSAGDQVTVTFPAHALLAPVAITATPVATTEGVAAVGAHPIGVELEPSGLGLLEQATMTVVPADGITARKAEGMVSASDGSDVHPEMLLPDATRLAMPVDHFTVVTVLVPNGDGTSTTQYFTQTEYTATLHNMLAQAIERARNAAVDSGGPVDINGTIVAASNQYWHDLALPLLEQSKSSCTFARANMTTVAAAVHDDAALGIDRPEWNPGLAAVLQNCWKEATATCMTMAPGRYSAIVGLAREMALLGVSASDGTDPDPFALDWCGDANGYITIIRDEVTEAGSTSAHEVARATVWVSTTAFKWWNQDGTFTLTAAAQNPTYSSVDLAADYVYHETYQWDDRTCTIHLEGHPALHQAPVGASLDHRAFSPATGVATSTQGLSIVGYPVTIPTLDPTLSGSDSCHDGPNPTHGYAWWTPVSWEGYTLTVDAGKGDVLVSWDHTIDDGDGYTHTVRSVIEADIHIDGLKGFVATGPP